jgi:catechol 2,3-dioxygenase-like lactoylglutathione lyase family enzyme
MLLVHGDDSFLRFIEAVGTPTTERRLPEASDTDLDTIVRVSGEHGAPIVGGSLEEDDARSFVTVPQRELSLNGIHHISVDVTDLRRSEQWYRDALGLMRVDGDISDDGTGHVAMVHPATGTVVGLASAGRPRVEHVAFACDDRDALTAWRTAMHESGLEPGSITDAPYGSGFVVCDPDGHDIEIFAPAPPG